jgi:hypothetical protein
MADYESRFHKLWMRPWLAKLLDGYLMQRVRQRYFGPEGNLKRYGLDPAFGPYETHAAVNDEVLDRISVGAITVKPSLERFSGPGTAHFTDGSAAEIDGVIFATGFSIGAPFLEEGLLPLHPEENRVSLYKEILNPAAPPTLAFIGLVQPQTGFMPVIEMQARWILQVWRGQVGLPDPEYMRAQIQRDRQERESMYVQGPRHTIEVEWPDYSDWFAREMGVLPGLDYARLRGLLLLEPIIGAQYRLRGPGAKPAIARQALEALARTRASQPQDAT